jgi:hypothetical protein
MKNRKREICTSGSVRDEAGQPPHLLGEVGLQEQASNRRELHRLRADVVNVAGKGGARLRQVRLKETNGSEPLMKCRNVSDDVETGTPLLSHEQRLRATCPLLNRRPA